MIDPITTQAASTDLLRLSGERAGGGGIIAPLRTAGESEAGGSSPAVGKTGSFGDLVTNLVESVDAKGKAAEAEVRKLMLGESDNLHRSMIALQESGVAFTLLLEVRNKLVESYQELMRMPV